MRRALVRALAEEITRMFTAEQRAELARLREDAQTRRQERQTPGFGPGGPAVGPGGPSGAPGVRSRTELRRRLLDRLIRRLEASN